MSPNKSKVGTKILYSLMIALCSLVLLASLAGIIGVWAVQRPIAEATSAILKVVEETSGLVRQAVVRADQSLAVLEATTTDVAAASQQLSQNVTDQGLAQVLLPEEKEQQLAQSADALRDTIAGIRESLANVLELYHSIDRLPFVNLPHLDDDQVEKIETAIDQTQTLVTEIRSSIADFRAGIAAAIGRVETGASRLNTAIVGVRESLMQADANLAALQEFAIRLQKLIVTILVILALILTLLFAFVIYTQVEVIRLYILRWRRLNQPVIVPAAASLDEPGLTQPGKAEPPIEESGIQEETVIRSDEEVDS